MPRDLFGDVTRPSISIGNRKWYSVPVSLLSHTFIIATIVVLPIIAAPLMPHVLDNEDAAYLISVLPPPPPPPLKRDLAEVKPIENPNAAPVNAPDTIAPEREVIETPDRRIDGIIGGSVNEGSDVLAPPPPVVTQTAPPQPVRPGFQGVRTPVKTRHVDPAYPQIAQQVRLQGIVIIEATIGQDGNVINARILRSVHLLDQAALDAVRQWQFTPTLLNGVPVPVIMTVTVNFTLK